MIRKVVVALVAVLLSACAREAAPAQLDTANTDCHYCRMTVSDVHFAAQLAAPGAEARFFDDIGCLRGHLKEDAAGLPKGAVAYVADHRTGAWVRAASAVFTKTQAVTTPMNGGVIAHADEETKQQDPAAAGGTSVTAAELFGPSGPPNGGRR